jgi:hypothetical protein
MDVVVGRRFGRCYPAQDGAHLAFDSVRGIVWEVRERRHCLGYLRGVCRPEN